MTPPNGFVDIIAERVGLPSQMLMDLFEKNKVSDLGLEKIVNSTTQEKTPKVIDHDRYSVIHYIDRGAWGEVYLAHDNEFDKIIAIKVLNPGKLATWQAEHRDYDLDELIKKEGDELRACAHVVPRKFEKDKNGKAFIIMPYYELFLSDVFVEGVFYNPSGKNVDLSIFEGKTAPFGLINIPSNYLFGVSLNEILDFGKDIATAIKEFHIEYGKAHLDVRFDNLALDNLMKVLLTDIGIATYVDSRKSGNSRDNIGHLYIRSPKLYVDGAEPAFSNDGYSFASLIYRMFTGKYLFQDEIDFFYKEGGMQAVELAKEKNDDIFSDDLEIIYHSEGQKRVATFMNQFYGSFGSGGFYSHTQMLSESLDSELSKMNAMNIPKEFVHFIKRTAMESFSSYDGADLVNDFENAIKDYNDRLLKEDVSRNVKRELKKNFAGAFASTTALAGGVIGLLWLSYFGSTPDWNNKDDFFTRASMWDQKTAGIHFEIESDVYEPVFDGTLGDYTNVLVGTRFKRNSLVNNLTADILTVADSLDNVALTDNFDVIRQRYNSFHIGEGTSGSISMYISDFLVELIKYELGQNLVDENLVDLEDFITRTV